MTVIGRAMGPMGAMAQGKAPFNAAVVQKNSALVDSLMGLPWNSFGPGTDKGAPTKADAKIWTEAAKFKQAAEGAQKAVANLAAASKSRGRSEASRPRSARSGKACKACHDDFRTQGSPQLIRRSVTQRPHGRGARDRDRERRGRTAPSAKASPSRPGARRLRPETIAPTRSCRFATA